MTEHHREPHLDVSALLTGETPPSERRAALAHVRDCADCRDQFVVLGAAMGEVRDAVRHAPVEPGEVPPLRLDRSDATAPDIGASVTAPVALAAARPRRSRLVRAGLGAAAAVLLVAAGFGAGRGLTDDGSSRTEVAAPAAPVPLVSVGSTAAPVAGSAAMTGEGGEQKMAIALAGLTAPAAGTHYTIWLIDTVGGRAREVGVMPESDATVMRAVFALPADEAEGYDALNVSVEDDETVVSAPTHSLLRGTLV
ncbi:anti-sigma factor [Nocardioides plantarum]|uniref:Anti-sigma factor family protein n=1 Tax=Nocardioides plantarum TaxID=29299 RepID=A0ABV5KCA0_9ACTN|nr:zf-HC2 domain-containing protein [Nocardioides plantarum]